MKKDQCVRMAKSLLSVPLYFGISYLISIYLKRFDIIGPVSSLGKPIFSHYSSIVLFGFFALIAIGLIYSLFQAIKVNGWQKYALIVLILLLLPIQYFWVIVMQMSIFGK